MFIVIPAKPFDQAKSRLGSLLALDERIRLSRSLLLRTLGLARQVGEVVVISRDKRVRQLAKQAGAWALVEAGTTLNGAVRQARQWIVAQGREAMLVLPGDLPLLTVSDLVGVIELGQAGAGVVIAPCHRGEGTNALWLSPPGLIDPAFGEGSFSKHLRAAQEAGVEPAIYHSPGLAFDLDWPEDLAKLKAERLNCYFS